MCASKVIGGVLSHTRRENQINRDEFDETLQRINKEIAPFSNHLPPFLVALPVILFVLCGAAVFTFFFRKQIVILAVAWVVAVLILAASASMPFLMYKTRNQQVCWMLLSLDTISRFALTADG